MAKEFQKTVISITMEPDDNGKIDASCRLEGAPDDLAVAFTELSKHVLNTYEEHFGKEFVPALYATIQTQIIQNTCLKESYDQCANKFERMKPLMDILGKTFKMPKKEEVK